MRILRLNFILFGLLVGAVIALTVTVIIVVWEWLENPGGIFRTADGTNWAFVRDTALSWLIPTFVNSAIVASVARLLFNPLALGYRKCRKSKDFPDDHP
jgi:hypothetical protein